MDDMQVLGNLRHEESRCIKSITGHFSAKIGQQRISIFRHTHPREPLALHSRVETVYIGTEGREVGFGLIVPSATACSQQQTSHPHHDQLFHPVYSSISLR